MKCGKKLRGWWFNPRDDYSISLGEFDNDGSKEFTPISIGRGAIGYWCWMMLQKIIQNLTHINTR
jgi:hypothetical protein